MPPDPDGGSRHRSGPHRLRWTGWAPRRRPARPPRRQRLLTWWQASLPHHLGRLAWWLVQLAGGLRCHAQTRRNELARAWYRRAASDRALAGPRPGQRFARELVDRLPSWLRPPASPSSPLSGFSPNPARGQRRAAPPPPPGRLAAMCAWAAGVGILGLPVAGRALLTVVAGDRPDWSDPGMATGLLGILLAVGSFLVAHRRRLPWLLLAVATTLLLGGPRLGD